MKGYVGCIGCEQRNLDAERVRTFLAVNGIEQVADPGAADVAILVTCAVDETNEARSLAALEDVLSRTPASTRILVGGCLPLISPKRIERSRIYATFSPRTLERLDDLMGRTLPIPMRLVSDPHRSAFDGARIKEAAGRGSARREYDDAKRGYKVRLNHGCLLACSYCVIRKATGLLESVPVETVMQAFQEAVERVEPTVMLMGGDTGAYGLDLGTTLPSLLEELLRLEGRHSIFIHDCNVNWLVQQMPEYARMLQRNEAEQRRIRAVCFPVQSGSDTVLSMMRRPYHRRDVLRCLSWIREHARSVAIGTHIIAGFPGETDDDFEQTLNLLRSVEFDFVTCFRYSEHPASPSAGTENKVPERVKQARLDRLRELLGDCATVLS